MHDAPAHTKARSYVKGSGPQVELDDGLSSDFENGMDDEDDRDAEYSLF